MDHRSSSRFSTGVPVIAKRCGADSFRIAFVWAVFGFLMFWASSSFTPLVARARLHPKVEIPFLYKALSCFRNPGAMQNFHVSPWWHSFSIHSINSYELSGGCHPTET